MEGFRLGYSWAQLVAGLNVWCKISAHHFSSNYGNWNFLSLNAFHYKSFRVILTFSLSLLQKNVNQFRVALHPVLRRLIFHHLYFPPSELFQVHSEIRRAIFSAPLTTSSLKAFAVISVQEICARVGWPGNVSEEGIFFFEAHKRNFLFFRQFFLLFLFCSIISWIPSCISIKMYTKCGWI